MEGLTRDYGMPLLVADTTRAAAGELPDCEWAEVDEVAVRGRGQLVTLFAPLAVPPANATFESMTMCLPSRCTSV